MGTSLNAPSRRRSWLWALVVVIVVLGAVAWVAGTRVRSTNEAAADAEPPAASWITSKVERRVLSATVVGRGDVVPRVATRIAVPASVVSGAVVTAIDVTVGDEVDEGDRVVEVSGRPVFVLQGDVPVYRTLGPVLSGADVAALQAAMVRRGCPADQDAGVYGAATKLCVAAMYLDAGYDWVPTSPTEASDVGAARLALDDAQAALDSAMQVLTAAQQGPAESTVLATENALDQARRALADAQAAANAPAAPGDGGGDQSAASRVTAAREAVRLAQVQLDELLAPPDVSAEYLAVGQASAARDRAQAALEQLEAATGPTVPQGEVVFVPSVPARVESVAAVVGPVGQPDPNQPGGAPASSGDGGLLVLSSGGLEVHGQVPATDVGLLREGMEVELLDELSGASLTARLAHLATEPTSSGSGVQGHAVVVEEVDEIPATWSGRNVRVTFTAAATDGEVLVVPLAAVSAGADGQARVHVLGSTGEPVEVSVEAGLSADGFVEVRPVDPYALDAGDDVVVGR